MQEIKQYQELKRLWDRFSLKILLCCTAYKDRFKSIEPELKRVGITNYLVQWDISSSPLKDILHRIIRTDGFLRRRKGSFSCCLNHYKAIKTAYELGHPSVLILEDDIRFRKNLQFIMEVLQGLPLDYDYVQFENLKPSVMSEEEYFSLKDNNIVNKYWRRFSNLTGGGCYALSRKAMGIMLGLIEHSMIYGHPPLKINDLYVGQIKGINKYFCYPNVAVQANLGQCNSNGIEMFWNNYYKLGMKYEEYEMQGTTPPKIFIESGGQT